MRLEGKVEAACVECEVWCVSPSIRFRISGVNLTGGIRARNAVSETPTMTPVSITQSMSALYPEHAHLLDEHGADHAALRQRETELADVQAREVDARATADAFLQATRAAEDRATRYERTAALPEREVGFLKALNVRLPRDYSVSLSSLGS